MRHLTRVLTGQNIEGLIRDFVASVDVIGMSGKTGLRLIESLKREALGVGPYPNVSLFEAANRIMSDLVILQGVAWLLKNKVFPFEAYTVEFGNEDKNGFDIRANQNGKTLIGEAFNVAPSFFPTKKGAALKKLRGGVADYRLLIVNHDATHDTYVPIEPGLHYFVVNITSGAVRTGQNAASLMGG